MTNQIIAVAEAKSRKPARRKPDNENLFNLYRLILQMRDLSVQLAPHDGVELESIIMSMMAILLPAMHDGILEKAWALHKLDPKPSMIHYRNARYRHRLRRAGDLVPALAE